MVPNMVSRIEESFHRPAKKDKVPPSKRAKIMLRKASVLYSMRIDFFDLQFAAKKRTRSRVAMNSNLRQQAKSGPLEQRINYLEETVKHLRNESI